MILILNPARDLIRWAPIFSYLNRKLEDIKLISIVMIPFASAVVGLLRWPNGA